MLTFMKKLKLLQILALGIGLMLFTGNVWGQTQLSLWNFQNVVSPTGVVANIQASDVTISAGSIGFQAGTDDGGTTIGNSGTWNTGDFTTTGKYLQFSVGPDAGYSIDLSSISLRFGRTAAGPTKVTVQYSLDDFATAGTTILDGGDVTSTSTGSLNAFSITTGLPVEAITETMTIRIWGHNASGTGNLRFNNFRVFGDVNPLVEIVATPVITPGTSNQFTSFEVTITTATEGATIHYSFDSETGPWTEYDGLNKPEVTGTSTIWAYATKAGMDNSDVASATYTFPIDVADIAAFRAGTDGLPYRITGEVVVLHRDGFRNRHFLRDASGSLTIWDDNTPNKIATSYNVGDGVTGFTGIKATEGNGALIIMRAETDPGAATNAGLDVTPVTLPIANIGLSHTGNLIEIEEVSFDVTGTFATGQNYSISDGSSKATMNFRTDFFGANYINTDIPAGTGTLTGIIGGFGTAPQITARDLEDLDFDEAPAPEPTNHPTDFSATANSSSAITVNWIDADPAAEGYLIKGSTDGFAAIDNPVDGTPELNAGLVMNVVAATGSHQFTGLPANTTHYFKIFPYNGAGTTINYKTDDAPEAQATTDAPPGLPYAQDFSGFVFEINDVVTSFGEDVEWTFDATGSSTDKYLYKGAWGSGTAGGFRGNANVLGYQHTGTTGVFTASLALYNNTGETIEELFISYKGMVERADQGRSPEWTVKLNDTEIPALFYSTLDGEDKYVWTLIEGLNIEVSEPFTISWSSDRGEPGGASKQIGISDVQVAVPVEYNPASDPDDFPVEATLRVKDEVSLTKPLQVRNILIEDPNSFVVIHSGTLTVTGIFSNSAGANGLRILSNAAGTGSLIHSTPGLQGTSQRFIPAHTSKSATGWHFLSSPVNNFAIGSSDFAPGTNDDFFAWDEETNTWLNYKVGSNNINNFINGEGYLVAYQNDKTGIFTGTFNVGDVAVDLNLTPSKDNFNGWNLLGNPYPSAIDWSVVGNHTDTFEDVFAYVWDRDKDGGAGYIYIDGRVPNAFIPANQGFFVKTKVAVPFTFTNDMRVHGGNFMKSSPADDRIVLRFAGDHYFDQTTLRLRKGSQFSRDPLDALKMFSFDTDVPQIYTLTTDQRGVAINSIPTVDESLVIPIGLVVPANGEMTITLKELSGDFENLFVLLLDQKTGVTHKFVNDQDGYTFDASTDDTDRFLLKFETVSVHELPAEAALHIYAHGSTVYLNSRESLDARIAVYNITGQQVHGQRMAVDGHSAINLNLPTGWYVVTVTTDKAMTTQKVFIR
jgi:hypothetical protein